MIERDFIPELVGARDHRGSAVGLIERCGRPEERDLVAATRAARPLTRIQGQVAHVVMDVGPERKRVVRTSVNGDEEPAPAGGPERTVAH